jgi:hypothetical protein
MQGVSGASAATDGQESELVNVNCVPLARLNRLDSLVGSRCYNMSSLRMAKPALALHETRPPQSGPDWVPARVLQTSGRVWWVSVWCTAKMIWMLPWGVYLGRSTDSGRLMLLKPKPTVECPEPSQVLVMVNPGAGFAQSSDAFNVTDGLAADVHGCIKRRGDRFESDEQLETWLVEDSVLWSGHELSDAVEQLEVAGWLTRPHREREWSSGPLPGFLVSPSWARGWYS